MGFFPLVSNCNPSELIINGMKFYGLNRDISELWRGVFKRVGLKSLPRFYEGEFWDFGQGNSPAKASEPSGVIPHGPCLSKRPCCEEGNEDDNEVEGYRKLREGMKFRKPVHGPTDPTKPHW